MFGLLFQEHADAATFYILLDRPRPAYPEDKTTDDNTLGDEVMLAAHALYKDRYRTEAAEVSLRAVSRGVDDVGLQLLVGLRHHGNMGLDKQLAYLRNDRSQAAIATFARLSDKLFHPLLSDKDEYVFGEQPEDGFATSPYVSQITELVIDGCPYAYNPTTKEATPIFKKAALWAGELALYAYDAHGITPDVAKP